MPAFEIQVGSPARLVWAIGVGLLLLNPAACGGSHGVKTTPDGAGLSTDAGEASLDARTESLAEVGKESPPDAGRDALADSASGAESECTGQPNFARCTLVTIPDRKYDICVDGVCVSPGCGTAECNSPGPHFKLGDTGQRECYDASGAAVACAPIDQCSGLCGQDGQLGWDAVNSALARFTRQGGAEPTVRDAVTGLVWQGCPAGTGGPNCAGTPADMLWVDALAWCDALSWGTYDDWRLPDEYELHSILDYGANKPAIDGNAFPGTPNDRFVSSSTYAAMPDGAWFSMWDGTGLWGVVVSKDSALSTGKVRCVRDSAVPALDAVRFERQLGAIDQPVVRDHVTGLVWQGCEAGLSGDDCGKSSVSRPDWAGALAFCEGLEWAGFTDWHLPDIKQLRSIIDNRRTNPGVDPTVFPNTATFSEWSSTTNVADPTTAWTVTIGFGGGVQDASKGLGAPNLPLRCVRVP